MKFYFKIFIILFVLYSSQCINCRRLKRNLVFPDAKAQIIFGMGIPVSLEDLSVTMGFSVRAFYALPSNASEILNAHDIIEREIRSLPTRLNIYTILANVLERFGGKGCVLKSICEITSHKLDISKGLMEKIFHYVLRPSTTEDVFSDPMVREYVAAENIGRKTEGRCSNLYPECAFSLIDKLLVRKYITVNN